MDGGNDADDRRQRSDRRAEGGETTGGRRGARPRLSPAVTAVVRSVVGVVVLIVVILATVRQMHPIYATRGTLGDELRKHAPDAAAAIGIVDSTNVDRLMATAKFQDEKRNFFEDVMRLKQVDSARADTIAQYAVREAYIRGISPAIIFGVMLTENSRFISNAKSNVGAVGLMQVYPKVWLTKEMTALFGRDLATDSTNVKYGVFILSHYFNPKVKGGGTQERDWATALLRYNGCVHGTNTPRCHTYPSKVQNFVEKQATSICNGRGFYECIAKPFIAGLFTGGKLTPDAKPDTAAATTTQAGEVAGATNAAAPATPGAAPTAPVAAPTAAASAPPATVAAPKAAVKTAAKATSNHSARKSSSSKSTSTRTARKPVTKKAPAKKAPAKKRSAPTIKAPKLTPLPAP